MGGLVIEPRIPERAGPTVIITDTRRAFIAFAGNLALLFLHGTASEGRADRRDVVDHLHAEGRRCRSVTIRVRRGKLEVKLESVFASAVVIDGAKQGEGIGA